jgi:hypothetical protein
MNLTKTVRRAPIDLEFQHVGHAQDDHGGHKEGPKYDPADTWVGGAFFGGGSVEALLLRRVRRRGGAQAQARAQWTQGSLQRPHPAGPPATALTLNPTPTPPPYPPPHPTPVRPHRHHPAH